MPGPSMTLGDRLAEGHTPGRTSGLYWPTVLVGECGGCWAPRLSALGWGRMWIARRPVPYENEPWGFDNGAFRYHLAGIPFDGVAFLRRLERAHAVGVPYLAVVPDIVAAGPRSLEFSLDWMPRLPRDWPWFLAVQDGMNEEDVAPLLCRLAGLFLGGSTAFKRTAGAWCALAHRHGRRFHYARAGTLARLAHAREIGADSLDSSFPMWTKQRFDTFVRHWRDGDRRLRIPGLFETSSP